MANRRISAENLGPITELGFNLDSPGVTVLVAPNGSGKTILLDAVQAAAKGEGKLPLRDRTRKGKVEAFGATITIGGTCRHTGEFEVTNLEGRFDLAALVDPRIKEPGRADSARIKALVSLTGVAAASDLFSKHEAFSNFDRIVRAGSLQSDDLVEMAAKIKKDYEEAARAAEDEAERETGHADGLRPAGDLDLKETSDSRVLQEAYDRTRDYWTTLKERRAEALRVQGLRSESEKSLAELRERGIEKEQQRLITQREELEKEAEQLELKAAELQDQLTAIHARRREVASLTVDGNARLATLGRQAELLAEAEAFLAQEIPALPSDEDLETAEKTVSEAQQAVERGALIRQALKDQEKAASHRKAASQARERAERYRDAGKATDEVLSSCIKCPQLRVESDGKSARLVADTGRGKSIPYHDLSDGEKWTTAIDIGADQVGKGGLLVISQIGWEGIDGKNRQIIHKRAVERGVYILTAEAAADPDAEREIVPTPFVESVAG